MYVSLYLITEWPLNIKKETKEEYNIKCIQEVKRRPVIWDVYSIDNKNITKKKVAYREISLVLKSNVNLYIL